MCVWLCAWKGAKDNYIEVAETGGLLIPNAVTLIKAERREGAANNSNPMQLEKKIYFIGNIVFSQQSYEFE